MATHAISEPSNGAKASIELGIPYIATVQIEGTADLLLHAWNVESIDAKAKSKKGSAAKKTDDIESYVRRNEDGIICLPSEYLRMSIINAAKFRQDPRSPSQVCDGLVQGGGSQHGARSVRLLRQTGSPRTSGILSIAAVLPFSVQVSPVADRLFTVAGHALFL